MLTIKFTNGCYFVSVLRMKAFKMINNTVNGRGNPLIILLVEDNPDHAELVMRSLENHSVANKIYHVADGESAINYLFQKKEFADRAKCPKPNVVLLDLRLPKVDGLEILKIVKKSKDLRQVPVVILSTSEAENDVRTAYDFHANSYLVKPVDFRKFTKMMGELGFYWLNSNVTTW